jgi:hypothetical protein
VSAIREMIPSEIALEARMVKHFGMPDADPHLRVAERYSFALHR